jgi:hypothetical protein
MAAVILNNMPKLIFSMRSDREYLVYMLQVIRLRKDNNETFKSLIDRGIKVAHRGKLITVGETNGDGKTNEREE